MREISGLIFLRVRFKRLPEGESGLFELALVFLMMLMLFAPLYGWKNPERGLPAPCSRLLWREHNKEGAP